MDKGMIRERVSIQGVIRPLEPESELSAFHLPEEKVGHMSELAIRRYHDAKTKFDAKFGGVLKTIEKHRAKNMHLAKKDTLRNIAHLLTRDRDDDTSFRGKAAVRPPEHSIGEGLVSTAGGWSWAWAIDSDERPPASSIVSRRDTDEARRLAKFADECVPGRAMSGNGVWSTIVDLLTASPDKRSEPTDTAKEAVSKKESRMSGLGRFVYQRREVSETTLSVSVESAAAV
jgi:hypothetical protein